MNIYGEVISWAKQYVISLILGQREVKQAIPGSFAPQAVEKKPKRRSSNVLCLMVWPKLSIHSGAHGEGAKCV